jgi:NADH-quinone oxidoreductase subunit N
VEVIAADQVWLAALAVVFSVIGAYYYLRIVKLMYFDESEEPIALKGSRRKRASSSAPTAWPSSRSVWSRAP